MRRFGGLLSLALFSITGIVMSLVMSSGSASAATTTVEVGDIYYCSAAYDGEVCTTTVTVGDTVVWDFSGAKLAHTVTDCGASCMNPTSSQLFDSGVVQGGDGPYQFTFTTAGTYNYYCQIHALQQQGKIVVQPASVSTTTPGASTSTPAAATPGGLPPTGYGPGQQSSSQWWAFGAMALLGVALGSGAIGYVKRR
jgi:plastocyanin